MKIAIDATGMESGASLEAYITKKCTGFEKLLSRFEKSGELEFHVEVRRTTRHHVKGDIYEALIDVRVPGKVLRASESADDVHAAIDLAKDVMKNEIEKYKDKMTDAIKVEKVR